MVRKDDEIARLAEQFVCVRFQSMNGVDLHLFQFERDLTWMAFFMDADDKIYTRYGGREDSNAESHLNKESLARTMKQVLDWHQSGTVKAMAPRPVPSSPRTPEDIPTMRAMIEKRRESKCIHCHDVKVAALRDLQRKSMLQRNMVFTYPPPTTVGIELDPMVQNQVGSVRPGSAAERAGIRSGDLIRTVAGERVFTMADFQDALEPQPPTATVPIELMRGDETVRTVLNLSGEWRRSRDPSWRESLYVVGPGGGFWGERLNEGDRKKHGLDPSNLAVRVTAVYGQHARDAGIKNGDIVVAFDGLRNDLTILQLHAHLQLDRPYGASIPIAVRRDGKQHDLVLRLPEHPSED